jgi:hypothetical protein
MAHIQPSPGLLQTDRQTPPTDGPRPAEPQTSADRKTDRDDRQMARVQPSPRLLQMGPASSAQTHSLDHKPIESLVQGSSTGLQPLGRGLGLGFGNKGHWGVGPLPLSNCMEPMTGTVQVVAILFLATALPTSWHDLGFFLQQHFPPLGMI